jgi:hypothetical protein
MMRGYHIWGLNSTHPVTQLLGVSGGTSTSPRRAPRGRELFSTLVSSSDSQSSFLLVAQDNLPEALKSYHDDLAIMDRLAKSDPGNAGWQRDLSVSYSRLAGAFRKAGDKAKTLDALRQGRAIMVRLTSVSPDNAVWKRDLGWFDGRLRSWTAQSERTDLRGNPRQPPGVKQPHDPGG